MKTNTETISDDNGVELRVTYEYEQADSQIEFGHGKHEVGLGIETNIKSALIFIDAVGSEILVHLTKLQKDNIISKLKYD